MCSPFPCLLLQLVKVFDTIPVANSLQITKKGKLFCASDFSNHMLFHFHKVFDRGQRACLIVYVRQQHVYHYSGMHVLYARPLVILVHAIAIAIA